MTSCTCSRARLVLREGTWFCTNCERPHTRKARNPGMPALVRGSVPRDRKGREAFVYEKASVSDAVSAVDEVIESGGSQGDAERKLRQVLCGPRTPYKTFQKGMQKGLDRIDQKLNQRDLGNARVRVTRKQSEHEKKG